MSGTEHGTRGAWARLVLGALVLLCVAAPQPVQACTPEYHCGCYRTVNLTVMNAFSIPDIVGTGTIPFDVVVTVGSAQNPDDPGFVCNDPGLVTGGVVEITFDCGGAQVFVGSIPLPSQTESDVHPILLTVPVDVTNVQGQICEVRGKVDADFSEAVVNTTTICAETIRAEADVTACATEEGDLAGLPRLILELSNSNPGRCGAGIGIKTDVFVTNADFDESVTFELFVSNTQNARLPTRVSVVDTGSCATNPCSSSISAPIAGDDYPLAFCDDLPTPDAPVPLPEHPLDYEHQPVRKTFTLGPGGSDTIGICTNSHPMCLDGSCSLVDFSAFARYCASPPCTTGPIVPACLSASLNVERGANCPDARNPAACCFNDDVPPTCQDLLPDDCVDSGGEVGDAFSACLGDSGDPGDFDDGCELNIEDRSFPDVACCFPLAVCSDLEGLECANAGGTPHPVPSDCGTTACPFLSNCCFANGVCQLLLESVCGSSGGGPSPDLLWASKAGFTWMPVVEAPVVYNIYRGNIADIAAGPLVVTCKNADDPDLTDGAFIELEDPLVGNGFFYVATYLDGTETGYGFSQGQIRALAAICP